MEQAREILVKIRDWLDGYGMPAWLGAMILGFVLFVPFGLVVLGYMIWSGRMGCWGKGRGGRRWRSEMSGRTGNAAFDAYREETLRKLEDERQAFTEFMERLRRAKDQAEFDQFMADRARGGAQSGGQASGQAGGQGGQPRPSGAPEAPSGGFGGPAPQPAG